MIDGSVGQPTEGIEQQLILDGITEGEGQLLVGLVFIVDIVVSHVNVNHIELRVRPNDRIIATVPNFVRLGSRAQRKTRWING